jgi:uncharacterized protein YjiS (DUF1127 family)
MTSAEASTRLQPQWIGLGAAKRLIQGLAQSWEFASIRRARNSTIAVLRALDDRTLKDIGIDRSEIESVVHAADEERKERRVGVFR